MKTEEKAHIKARWIADLVKTENDLITQRTGWNLTAQALLIAGLALIEKSEEAVVQTVIRLVPLLGAAFGMLTLFSVNAAFRKIDDLKTEWNTLIQTEEFASLTLVSPISDGDIHTHGKWAPQWMPACFSIFWVILFVSQFVDILP